VGWFANIAIKAIKRVAAAGKIAKQKNKPVKKFRTKLLKS